MKNKGVGAAIIVIIIVVAAGAVGGYMVMSGDGGTGDNESTGGGGTPSTVSSVDVTYSGYSSGDLTGARIRARELGSTTPDVRVDEVGGDQVYIYNNDESAFYSYSPSTETWTKYTGTIATTTASAWTSWATTSQSWALTYGVAEDQTVTYGNESLTITVNSVNDGFDDSIFTPPADATVEEYSVSV